MKLYGLSSLLVLGLCSAGEVPFKTVGFAAADLPGVQGAIDAVPADSPSRKLILIQPGAYFSHRVLSKPRVRVAELGGTGPGAAANGRVDWAKSSAEVAAVEFSREMVLGDWKP